MKQQPEEKAQLNIASRHTSLVNPESVASLPTLLRLVNELICADSDQLWEQLRAMLPRLCDVLQLDYCGVAQRSDAACTIVAECSAVPGDVADWAHDALASANGRTSLHVQGRLQRCYVPLIAADQLVGGLAAAWCDTAADADQMVPMLDLIAPMLAAALHVRQLSEAHAEDLDRARMICVIHPEIIMADSLQSLFDTALRHLTNLSTADHLGAWYCTGSDGGPTLCLSWDGVAIRQNAEPAPTAAYAPETLALLKSGEMHAVRDLTRLTAPSAHECQLLAKGLRAYVQMPLLSTNTMVGVLELAWRFPVELDALQSVWLQNLAFQVVVGMQNLWHRAQLRGASDELELLVQQRTMQLEKAKRHVETILHNSADAIVMTDPRGRIEQTNARFNQQFNAEPDQYFDQPLHALAQPVYYAAIDAAVTAALEQQHVIRVEFEAADFAQVQHMAMSLAAVRQQGEVSGIIITLHDITAHKQVEIELMHNLIREKELRHMRSQFVSMASHQFRTPLSVIMSAVQAYTHYYDRMTPEQREKRVTKIHQQIERLTEILDDVLTVSQLEENLNESQPQLVDLDALVSSIVQQFRARQSAANLARCPINYEHVASPEQPVSIDVELLDQIVDQLLSNAMKFSPQGGEINVRLDLDGNYALLRVEDHGIGIPIEDQPYVFDSFHRAENAISIEGTGLGLTIIRQTVQLLGGHISLVSVPGEGTAITIGLPVLRHHETHFTRADAAPDDMNQAVSSEMKNLNRTQL